MVQNLIVEVFDLIKISAQIINKKSSTNNNGIKFQKFGKMKNNLIYAEMVWYLCNFFQIFFIRVPPKT
jgi:hypothetical protein